MRSWEEWGEWKEWRWNSETCLVLSVVHGNGENGGGGECSSVVCGVKRPSPAWAFMGKGKTGKTCSVYGVNRVNRQTITTVVPFPFFSPYFLPPYWTQPIALYFECSKSRLPVLTEVWRRRA